MPKTRSARLTFALVVLVLLGIIGRNVYHRWLNNCLIAAIEQKKVSAVRTLLEQGADPNSRKPGEGQMTSTPALALAIAPYSGSSTSRDQQEVVCLYQRQLCGCALPARTRRKCHCYGQFGAERNRVRH